METFILELNSYWMSFLKILTPNVSPLDNTEVIFRLVVQVLLLMASGFFSMADTALFSLSRVDLERMRRERETRLANIHALLEQPRRLIISILSGDELINIAAAANMTAILVILYGQQEAGWINLIVMVPLLLLFGEITPKVIAVSNPSRLSTSVVAIPMSFWVKLITPLRWAIRLIADRVTSLIVGQAKAADNILQIDEFRTVIDEAAEAGGLNPTERSLVYNLLEAGARPVVEIMTPRTKVKFVDGDNGFPEIVAQCKIYRHERIPVYRINPDNVIGFIHAEDILPLVTNRVDLTTVDLNSILRPPVIAPWTKKIDEMFDFFRTRHAQAALVLNEFGGVEGLVTIRDVLSYVFSQTVSEVTSPDILHIPDAQIYELPGDTKLTEFNRLTNFGILDPRVTTIGGLLFCELDRLPVVGDQVKLEDIELTVLEMEGHRIARVRVARTSVVEALNEDLESHAEKTPIEYGPDVEPQPDRSSDRSVRHEDKLQTSHTSMVNGHKHNSDNTSPSGAQD